MLQHAWYNVTVILLRCMSSNACRFNIALAQCLPSISETCSYTALASWYATRLSLLGLIRAETLRRAGLSLGASSKSLVSSRALIFAVPRDGRSLRSPSSASSQPTTSTFATHCLLLQLPHSVGFAQPLRPAPCYVAACRSCRVGTSHSFLTSVASFVSSGRLRAPGSPAAAPARRGPRRSRGATSAGWPPTRAGRPRGGARPDRTLRLCSLGNARAEDSGVSISSLISSCPSANPSVVQISRYQFPEA